LDADKKCLPQKESMDWYYDERRSRPDRR
jgi:hypothetical protein